MAIKKYTRAGNIIFYIGLIVFIFGLSMNENIGWKKFYPEHYTSYSTPIMIVGVVIVIVTNFFRKKKLDESGKGETEKNDRR
ncbi:hypothetical protein CFK37_01665 [Virgibacillus phasianinus]|uniref:DUF3098 domain-containing protein n=1 Tax=Virgibacillus phasianinus TaxID=2017483 RepID=A0A220TYS7_9BACI|nr:hypothetical protein [Virgibacillus phasianinus]ASK61008.1 hypothetical protein CFK37_01665 [Virgibacillus phasianinus]